MVCFGGKTPVPSPGGGSGDQRCVCIQCFFLDLDYVAQSAGSGVACAVGAVAVTFGNFWLMLHRVEEGGDTKEFVSGVWEGEGV